MKVQMITLMVFKGKEAEAKEMLRNFLEGHKAEVMDVLGAKSRATHFHVIVRDGCLDERFLEKWPGSVKVNQITDSQAERMKQSHKKIVIL